MILDVDEDRGRAVALYERLGWRLADRRQADWVTPRGERLPVRIYLAPQDSPVIAAADPSPAVAQNRPSNGTACGDARPGQRCRSRSRSAVGHVRGRL